MPTPGIGEPGPLQAASAGTDEVRPVEDSFHEPETPSRRSQPAYGDSCIAGWLAERESCEAVPIPPTWKWAGAEIRFSRHVFGRSNRATQWVADGRSDCVLARSRESRRLIGTPGNQPYVVVIEPIE
jgi:hypothetical protein